MHGYARRNSVEGLARDTACRAAGQIGESGPPRSTDVRRGSSCDDERTDLARLNQPPNASAAGSLIGPGRSWGVRSLAAVGRMSSTRADQEIEDVWLGCVYAWLCTSATVKGLAHGRACWAAGQIGNRPTPVNGCPQDDPLATTSAPTWRG